MNVSHAGWAVALFASVSLNCAAAGLAAECSAPTAPAIPSGDTASEPELVQAQQAVKAFDAGTKTYTDCLTKAEAALGDQATTDQRKELVAMHNAAVEALQKTADQFNQSVRTFKARPK